MHSKHFEGVELAPGVFSTYANPDGAAFGNAAVIDLGDRTLVFDTTLTPQSGRDLRSYAVQVTGREPDLVVLSHYHNDHTWGSQAFADLPILATDITRQQLSVRGTEQLRLFREGAPARLAELKAQLASETEEAARRELGIWTAFYRGVVEALPGLRPPLPGLTFERRLTVHGERRDAHLIEYRGAHTASDTILHLPGEGIAFLSDLLFIGCHPLMVDGNPAQLISVLNELLELEADIFVPGHGRAGTRDDIRRMIAYVEECQALAAGCASDDDLARLAPPPSCGAYAYRAFFEVNMRYLRTVDSG